jgi:hypothetical protein
MDETVNPHDAATTYRYLRLGLVALVIFLAASILTTARNAHWGWQTSISAYFYTSSHTVFVASLCAVGICLLIYQGSTITEDSLLNFSGFLAIVVGLVPTGREKLRGPGLPCDFDPTVFADNSMWALLIVSLVAAVVVLIIQRLSPVPQDPQDRKMKALTVPPRLRGLFRCIARPMACVEALLPWAPLAALIVGAAFFIVAPDTFIEGAHGIAAFTMFCGIILVVVHYAFYALLRPQRRLIFVATYIVIALAMVLTLGLAAALHLLSHGHGVIIIEAIVIFEFAVFWLAQSIDLWKLEKYRVGALSELLKKLGDEQPADGTLSDDSTDRR